MNSTTPFFINKPSILASVAPPAYAAIPHYAALPLLPLSPTPFAFVLAKSCEISGPVPFLRPLKLSREHGEPNEGLGRAGEGIRAACYFSLAVFEVSSHLISYLPHLISPPPASPVGIIWSPAMEPARPGQCDPEGVSGWECLPACPPAPSVIALPLPTPTPALLPSATAPSPLCKQIPGSYPPFSPAPIPIIV